MTQRRIAVLVLLGAALPLGLYAESQVGPYGLWVFQSRDVIKSAEVNENFEILGEHMTTYENAISLDGEGNVGIGVSDPLARLHVKGTSHFDGGDFLRVNSAAPSNQKIWRQFVDSNSWYLATMPDDLKTESIFFRAVRSGTLVKSSSFLQGNVGIGTSNPEDVLELSAYDNGLTLHSLEGSRTRITFKSSDVETARIESHTGFGLRLGTAGNKDQFIIDASGNTGIGTTTPRAELEVVGSALFDTYVSLGRSGSEYGSVGFNVEYTDSNGSYRYIKNDFANLLKTGSGKFEFFTAPQGTSGEAIGFTSRLTISNAGNVGIGTTSPQYPLHMASGARVTAGGVWTDASSREFKEHIQDVELDEAISALEDLHPVRFRYKRDPGEEHLGFIAEDVPALVAMNDRKSLSAMDIVAVLTRVTQEQHHRLEQQQTLIDRQTALLRQQQALADAQQARLDRQEAQLELLQRRLQSLERRQPSSPAIQGGSR